jgi:hypothetical protein
MLPLLMLTSADAPAAAALFFFSEQRQPEVERMAPKADVEQVVNPIAPLEDDDDPFLVSTAAGHFHRFISVEQDYRLT